MSFTLRISLCFLASGLTFISPTLAQSQSAAPATATQYSADEAALRSLAESFFFTWTAKDLDGFLRLWTPKAPDLESRKQETQKLFADHEKIEVKKVTVYKVTIDGDKARLRADVEVNAAEAKTGEPAPGFGLLKRVINCARENGSWGVWSEESAFENLAKALMATATEKERDTLLEAEKDLWSRELTKAINNEGIRYGSQGLYPKAMNVFRIAQSVAEKINDSSGVGSSLNNIGLVHSYQGDYNLALESLQKSLRLKEAVADLRSISYTWNNLGLLYQRQGDLSQAIASYKKALEMAQVQENKSLVAIALGNIGNIYIGQGNYSLAAEYHQKSLALYRELGDKGGEGSILHSLGIIQHWQGDIDLAIKFYKESLALKEQTGDRMGQGRTLDALGDIHLAQGDYKLAEEFFRKSLAIYEASDVKMEIASSLLLLGGVYLKKGDYDLASEYFHKSLLVTEAIGNKEIECDSLNQLAKVYLLQGKPAQALEASERATKIAKGIGSLEMLSTALTHMGRAQRLLSRPALASQAFEEAVATIEALRTHVAGGEQEAQGYFEGRASAYHELVRLLIDQNKFCEALAYVERAKGRALLDVLQHGRADIQKAMTVEEREQERRLKSELTQLNTQLTSAAQSNKPDDERISEIKPQLEKARRNYEAFQNSLYTTRPELKVQRGEASIIKTEELETLLPDATSALLEYVVTDEATYLFVVSKPQGRAAAETNVFTIPIKRTDLAKQIEGVRRRIAERNLGIRAPAHKLYDLLLKPAQSLLGGKSSLVIVPDDRLWELPFQALLDEQDRYLIERSAVSYAPSLTVLREMRARSDKRRAEASSSTLLALGNPLIGKETVERARLTMRDEKLSPLPEAEAEVRALGRLYGARRSKVYVGVEAREDRLKAEAGQARILHFATHGVLNNASPLYSYLALAQGDKNEDGLLEAWELMQLDLKADLAVLSACETARGRTSAGEGVIGLTWALFVAGTPATVVSQWEVESTSARDLMLNFHRQLRAPRAAGKLTKAESLRRAALKLMKNPGTNHPFYWAGFVLVGDGR